MNTAPEIRSLPVPDGLEGERVDAALARMFGFSRTKAAELAAGGKVVLDGAVAGKSERVHGGAWLEVEMPAAAAPVQVVAEPVEGMEIVHDDDDVVVVMKPVGVAAHPSPGWTGPTVIGGLAAAGFRVATSGAAERQGIVHRLDVGTSGLMVVAKSERAYTRLKQQFRDRVVDKRYHALVQGHPDPLSGTIDAPIGRHPTHDYKWAVVADGKPSVTHYDLVEAFRSASLLKIKLETGRTHQIRVHMSAHRHPCVGAVTSGAPPTMARRLGLTRQWLHAKQLGFAHPADGEWASFESDYPDDLRHALETVRAESG
jgi:23S rRNA pseudouridine1911/1915/1917 synthase